MCGTAKGREEKAKGKKKTAKGKQQLFDLPAHSALQ
jgi:hypothetical protein